MSLCNLKGVTHSDKSIENYQWTQQFLLALFGVFQFYSKKTLLVGFTLRTLIRFASKGDIAVLL